MKLLFCLAPRNGELSPSDPETPEPFNPPLIFELLAKFGVGRSKLGVQGHIPRDKKVDGEFFLTFEVAKLIIVFVFRGTSLAHRHQSSFTVLFASPFYIES